MRDSLYEILFGRTFATDSECWRRPRSSPQRSCCDAGIGDRRKRRRIQHRQYAAPSSAAGYGSLQSLRAQRHASRQRATAPQCSGTPTIVDYRKERGVFSDLAGVLDFNFAGLSAENRADRIAVAYVTGNFFSMLGVGSGPGRPILPSEGSTFGADPVIVLGRSVLEETLQWRCLGRRQARVLVNGRPFIVAGVVPEGFLRGYALVEFDVYMPFGMMFPEATYKELIEHARQSRASRALGRLKPGVTPCQAQATTRRGGAAARAAVSGYEQDRAAACIPSTWRGPSRMRADTDPLVAGVFLLLVVARAARRVRERREPADGARDGSSSRARACARRSAPAARRLVRQMLTESLLLAAAGGFTGALIGRWLSALLSAHQAAGRFADPVEPGVRLARLFVHRRRGARHRAPRRVDSRVARVAGRPE